MTPRTARISVYTWQGSDRSGSPLAGELSAQTPALVRAKLRQQGITPNRVRRKSAPLLRPSHRIKARDIALFTRQLASMMKAGVPLLQAFDIIAEGLDTPGMRPLVLALKRDIEAGNSLAAALRKHPRCFDELYCNLVEAGEQAGALDTLLERVATYKEKSENLKARVKKSLIYPLAVVAVAAVVSAILLVKVVPQFQSLFAGINAPLPAFTQWVIALSQLMQHGWWMLGLGGLGALLGLRHAHRRSKRLRDALDSGLLKLPLLGTLLYKSAVARYARTLATTFAAGVPLLQALSAVAQASGNHVFQQAIERIGQNVANGMQLNFAMRSSGVFPGMAIQMTAIGEESGTLEQMLEKVAQHYETEVDNLADSLASLLEPFIMIILGTLVGGLVVAMYLPIFQLGTAI
jgi:type IV pilus assembly protein PilC